MRRNAMQQLYDWKEKSTRKPLIIRGARQVGKTWLMKEFAATAYKQFAYINFEDNEVMKEVFQKDFDIERIFDGYPVSNRKSSRYRYLNSF